jgi:hypothetical protein
MAHCGTDTTVAENCMPESIKQMVEHLSTEIRSKAGKIAEDRDFYRKMYLQYTICGASLAALTTFLIGAGQILDTKALALLALATSAAGTVIAAWGANFRHREMWVQKTTVLSHLRELQSRLELAKVRNSGEISQSEIDDLYEKYQDTMRAASETWRSIRDPQAGGQAAPSK